ncbi:hypothetical protein SBRY_30641 [Actinacidiphila bryophytorum]|uniref:RNA polymerase sigma factor 70 region 4 type 2 domain-containing protein n=1 Tax=Actinacidiphila bryophytorum TaxID=1436133 RepID=A0A9W4H1E8_9ACTN|nr:hypothetical protein SBRY_30641 [Actinacidiphila bryophytorum]
MVQFLTASVPDRGDGGQSETVEHRVVLKEALASLSTRQRAAVVLRYWDDPTETQTADILGCSPNSVKVHTRRALAALRGHTALAAAGSRARRWAPYCSDLRRTRSSRTPAPPRAPPGTSGSWHPARR